MTPALRRVEERLEEQREDKQPMSIFLFFAY